MKEGSFKSQKLSKTKSRRGALEAKRHRAELGQDLTRNDLLPDLHVQQVGTGEIQPSPRRTAPKHIERLMASIADFGFSVPILIARREIVDGHVRVEAALHLGLDTVPAIEVSHLSDTAIRRLRLALNRTAELGEWDLDQLRIEFDELIDLDVDLSSTGFTAQEQDIILLDAHEEGESNDEVDENQSCEHFAIYRSEGDDRVSPDLILTVST